MNNQNHNYDKITEENSRWTQNLDRRPLENEDDAKPEISSLQEYESKGQVFSGREEIKEDRRQNLMGINEEDEEDKWDKVTKQNDLIFKNSELKAQFGYDITYKAAYIHLSSLDLSNEKAIIKRTDYSHMNIIKKLCLQCTGKLKLDISLLEERDIILSLMKTKLTISDNYHYSMLYSIYKHLTGSGNIHWEKIGFQSINPADDVRGAGILGVLQALYFVENYKGVAAEYYSTSRDQNYNYPFICTLFQFTALSADCLREGRIISVSNRLKSVEKAFNDLYAGAFIIFMDNWIKDKSTITDYGAKFSTMKKYVKQNINTVLMKAQTTLVEKRNIDMNIINMQNYRGNEILKPNKDRKQREDIAFDSIQEEINFGSERRL